MSEKKVLVPIAEGVEEIEAVTIVDVLRRAGVNVTLSALDSQQVVGANGIKLVADEVFDQTKTDTFDAIVLPGGTLGAENFIAHQPLSDALKKFYASKKILGAICASPALVFAPLGFLHDTKATCYPDFKDKLPVYVDEIVVVNGNIVTSQGPGTALDFSLALASMLTSQKVAKSLKEGMLV